MNNKKRICDYDLIIVGGGPAGTTASFLLSKNNFKVLLIDKAKFPRSKLCGGLLTEKTLNLLLKIFALNLNGLKKDNVIDYIANSYQIYYKNKQISSDQMDSKFYLVQRIDFDNYLLSLAQKKGVKVIEDTRVTDIDFQKNTVVTDKGKQYSSNYIIGADGANSIIKNKILKKRNLKNNHFIKNNKAMTIETKIPRSKIEFDIISPIIYFGIVNWGYGWVFPKSDSLTVGLGGLYNSNKDFKKTFMSFLKLLNLDHLSLDIKGWPLPYGNYIERPSYKNTFLIGDAANLADPFTGEGLYYALKSAQIISEVLVQNKENKITITKSYNKRIQNEIISKLKKAKLYRTILWSSPKSIEKLLISVFCKYFHKKITNIIQGNNIF